MLPTIFLSAELSRVASWRLGESESSLPRAKMSFKPALPEVAKLSLFVLKTKHKNLEESIGTRFTLAGEADFWIAAGGRKEGSTFP